MVVVEREVVALVMVVVVVESVIILVVVVTAEAMVVLVAVQVRQRWQRGITGPPSMVFCKLYKPANSS